MQILNGCLRKIGNKNEAVKRRFCFIIEIPIKN